MRHLWLILLLLIPGCSSFSIRTSTFVTTVQSDGGTTVTVTYTDSGNIPGAGIQSDVPVVNPRVRINTQMGGSADE